jgi:hypothetical protein
MNKKESHDNNNMHNTVNVRNNMSIIYQNSKTIFTAML